MSRTSKIIYEIKRELLKKQITGNLGKTIEDEDTITCYIKKNKLKEKKDNYIINCFDIKDNKKELAKSYYLDKPICYIIDNLEFPNQQVIIYGDKNCEIIIKNCKFKTNLNIESNGYCTIDNTSIESFCNILIKANNLTIINTNKNLKTNSLTQYIEINSKNKINIIDSYIENTTISLSSNNELNIINSQIKGNKIICNANIINSNEKSNLEAETINIKTNSFNQINITAKTITLNNNKIENKKESITLKKATDSLTKKRIELLNTLKRIKYKYKNKPKEKTIEYNQIHKKFYLHH